MARIITGIDTVENRIHSFFHNYNLGQLLRQSNIRKEGGVFLNTLFKLLRSLVFTGKNLYRLLESPEAPVGIGKDSFWLHTSPSPTKGEGTSFDYYARLNIQKVLYNGSGRVV